MPWARELGARAFVYLPLPLSAWTYAALRASVFRDNERRLPTFHAAFRSVSQTGASVGYLEFGVARGTSLISAAGIAGKYGLHPRLLAFDSFCGLPSGEGSFKQGDMAYSEETFKNFVRKAGVDTTRVRTVRGFFEDTLKPELRATLELDPGVYVVHVDCDLYESTRHVLDWLKPILGAGSVLIFDDWFAFDSLEDPQNHGEQRAFAEWSDRPRWSKLHVEDGWNIAFVCR